MSTVTRSPEAQGHLIGIGGALCGQELWERLLESRPRSRARKLLGKPQLVASDWFVFNFTFSIGVHLQEWNLLRILFAYTGFPATRSTSIKWPACLITVAP